MLSKEGNPEISSTSIMCAGTATSPSRPPYAEVCLINCRIERRPALLMKVTAVRSRRIGRGVLAKIGFTCASKRGAVFLSRRPEIGTRGTPCRCSILACIVVVASYARCVHKTLYFFAGAFESLAAETSCDRDDIA